MSTLREYEVRLLDENGQVFLVIPILAVDLASAEIRAAALRERESADRYTVREQLTSLPLIRARSDGSAPTALG